MTTAASNMVRKARDAVDLLLRFRDDDGHLLTPTAIDRWDDDEGWTALAVEIGRTPTVEDGRVVGFSTASRRTVRSFYRRRYPLAVADDRVSRAAPAADRAAEPALF